ncbi:phosphopantetheine-binding protein [Brevibacillus humidisoli]|uniref:phosphopantetheine-binding protein n=1 Tax=Brevibacillus humidisoli TaxID=2895522 RepID=UPI001E658C35|nr:phosphopantetheine-binding protein [Brevibacillus humidisoli]UFJ42417.1 phosphopantetheine-binding protein [Brevibacillus humidisoli]
MSLQETVIEIVKNISGRDDVHFESDLLDLDMNSVKLIEMLIELEMTFDVDVLDEQLNLDELNRVCDVYEYMNRLLEQQ